MELTQLSRTVLGMEAAMTTVVFMDPDEPDLAVPLERRADSWRALIKEERWEWDDGTAVEFIGQAMIGLLLKLTNVNILQLKGLPEYGTYIKQEDLDKWREWHKESKAEYGMKKTVTESLQELVVRRKGPRMARGEVIDDGYDRLMIKIRPQVYQAHLWRPMLAYLKGYAVQNHGYVSYRQPPSPGIRKLAGGPNRSQDWD